MRNGVLNLFRSALGAALTLLPAANLPAANVEVTSFQETVSQADRAVSFYEDALQFRELGRTQDASGTTVTLQLGRETLLIFAPAQSGQPVPPTMTSNDIRFQHLAIVVSDLDAAYRRLREHHAHMVSTGPQILPDWNFESAEIGALYFRDPDGHFLELIHFPSNKGEPEWHRHEPLFLGIDHSAIVVRDMKAARHFYRDLLGFTIEGESFNHGIEQERLSGVPGAQVQITSLRGAMGPGVELLHYNAPRTEDAFAHVPAKNDALCWQINLRTSPAHIREALGALGHQAQGASEPIQLHDPDGHALFLTPSRISFPSIAFMRDAVRRHWTRYLMEGAELGIFMIVALYLTVALEHPRSPLRAKIASDFVRRLLLGAGIGTTVVALIYCEWGRQSGAQFNPSVTLARLSLGRIEPWDALFYIIAQFIGGWLLLVLAGLPLRRAAGHKKVKWVVTQPGPRGILAAIVAEFIISFLIFFLLLLTHHFPETDAWIGYVAGVQLCAFITLEAPFSGMSLNPARSVASALAAGSWKAMWLYFLVPPLAMLIAAGLCRWLIDS